MRPLNSLYTAFYITNFLVLNLDFDFEFKITALIVKFVIAGIIAMIMSVVMLNIDEHSETPSKRKVFASFILSGVFVWLGYEWSVASDIIVVIPLALSFIVGLFAIPICSTLKEELPKAVKTIVQGSTEWFNKKFKQ